LWSCTLAAALRWPQTPPPQNQLVHAPGASRAGRCRGCGVLTNIHRGEGVVQDAYTAEMARRKRAEAEVSALRAQLAAASAASVDAAAAPTHDPSGSGGGGR
jgi:hypothetical protein